MEEKLVFKKSFGKCLRQKRTESKLTLQQLGLKADLDDNYIGKIERGQKIPSVYIFTKLSESLDLNLQYFLHEVKEEMESELSSKKWQRLH
ncbi:helix-turn-helix domain-containing protein [Sediminibacillus albus]|uniref:Helix-turn-helix n=1 Tax=Sediminibacillus albus TaxID=407036 RepID=A0A1G8Y495_9BACI|nr:helix-turn-helix transcriptional regulator [Sediminibacillus albus]SDJ97533.1 Helix-turn-helix [Sediminibacillus albus]